MGTHLPKYIERIFLILFLTLPLLSVKAQNQVVVAGPDTAICAGQQVTLNATVIGSGPGNQGTVNLSDDQYSGVVPIGFNFNYWGNTYNSCIISSNGYVSFNTGNANGYSSWSINGGIPGNGPANAIMAPWQDINPSAFTSPTGVISYKTVGNAPNRIFIVEFRDINMFSCTNICYGAQIHLYEGSNIIETHIASKQLCPSWNSGRAIHGIQNANGTQAVVVPGRNFPTQWSATADGQRFTPNGGSYTVAPTAFSPIFIATNIPAIQWTTLGGAPVGSGNSINVSPNTTTSYIARLPYSSCGTSFFEDTVTVTIAPLPITTSNDTAICAGDSALIWANAGGQNLTYSWAPAATVSSPNAASTWVSPAQTTAYTVTVTSPICSNTSTINVTVNPLPLVDIQPANPSICPEDDVQLTASGAASYSWSPTTGLSDPSIANPIADPNQTTTYIVTGTSAQGCVQNDTTTVTIFPAAVVDITPAQHSMCLNDTVVLNASGGANYVWSPANFAGQNTGQAFSVAPITSTTYKVIGTDANGCVDSAFAPVEIWANPVVDFSVAPDEACVPATFNFTDNSTVAAGTINQWEWFIDGKGYQNDPAPVLTYNTPGAYGAQLIVTTSNGCRDSLRIDSLFFARPNPVADFSHDPEKVNIGDPTYRFFDESTPDVTNWTWRFGNSNLVNEENPNWTFNEVGEFEVMLRVANQYGCTDSIGGVVIVEGISEIWIPNAFTPNGDGLNETFFPKGTNLTENVSIEVLIYDRWGNLVYEGDNPNKPWNGKAPDHLTDCQPGTYSYKIIFINERNDFKEFLGKVNLIR